jgi:hypothetical protein
MMLACEAPTPAPRTFDDAAPDTVILVIGCTLRADRLHSYGNPRATSPTLDQLAAEAKGTPARVCYWRARSKAGLGDAAGAEAEAELLEMHRQDTGQGDVDDAG